METKLKQLISDAVKSNNTIAKDVLRVVLGQIQTESSTKSITEDQKLSIVKKIIKSNEITLGSMEQESPVDNWSNDWKSNAQQLKTENQVLQSLLPQLLSSEEIEKLLTDKVEEIKATKGDGQAIGIAMKFLKSLNAAVNNNDVKDIVVKIRT